MGLHGIKAPCSLPVRSGNDNLTGSTQRDWIVAGNGRDIVSAGAGSDNIFVDSDDIVAGETIDGGTGADPLELDFLELSSAGTTDLSPLASLDNVEVLRIRENGATAILTRDELVSEVWGAGAGSFTQAFILNSNSASLSSVFFENWGGADQTITINGTSGTANTLFGSSEKDTINGLGTSADSMTGGGGADMLNGGGGDDRFWDFESHRHRSSARPSMAGLAQTCCPSFMTAPRTSAMRR